jgi:hypothetical protein
MSKLIVVLMSGLLMAGTAFAGSDCESKAIGKNGKPLSGAAKTSFMKKCEGSAAPDCEALAVSKDGKPLSGAAKASSIKKCEASAKS